MVDNGIWVNLVMVLTGYAGWYERYALDEDQLQEARETAREAKRGLWAERNAVAPLGLAEGREEGVRLERCASFLPNRPLRMFFLKLAVLTIYLSKLWRPDGSLRETFTFIR